MSAPDPSNGLLSWRGELWSPPGSGAPDRPDTVTHQLVRAALAASAVGQEGAGAPGSPPGIPPDAVVVVGLPALARPARAVPEHLPLIVVAEPGDLTVRGLTRTVPALLRGAARVNLVLVAGDREVERLVATRIAVPIAVHGDDPATLSAWIRRAHAYGHPCGRRRTA